MFKLWNLAIRFILELILLFSIGYWGFHYGSGLMAQVGLGIGLPLRRRLGNDHLSEGKDQAAAGRGTAYRISNICNRGGMPDLFGFYYVCHRFALVALVNRFIVIKWRMQP